MAGAAQDGVLAQEQACEATSLWLLGQYEAALETLQKLEDLLPQDCKVQHNQAVAEFYASSAPDLAKLRQQLAVLQDPQASEPAGSPAAHSSECAAARINAALLLFLQHQHASALSLLTPLWQHVNALHDGCALRLCELLVELHLAARQPAAAAEVIEYLEEAGSLGRQHPQPGDAAGSSATDGSSSTRQQPQRQHHAGGSETDTDGVAGAEAGVGSSDSLALPRVTRITSPLMSCVAPLLDARGAAASFPRPGSALLLRLLRTRAALAAGRTKAAKRELRGLLAAAPGDTLQAPVLLLKAEVEAARHHPRKALKLLQPLLHDADALASNRVAALNALGVLHHHFGKHQTALLYLSAALAEFEAGPQPGTPTPVAPACASQAGSPRGWALASDPRPTLQYSSGLQHLMLGDYQAALRCLTAAACTHYTQPLLWVRLAEASIGMFMQRAEAAGRGASAGDSSASSSSSPWPLAEAVIGQGQAQRLLLPESHALSAAAAAEALASGLDAGGGEGAAGAAALQALLTSALLQLHTALALLADLKAEVAKADKAAAAAATLPAPATGASLAPNGGAQPDDAGSGSSTAGGGAAASGAQVSGPAAADLEPVQQAALTNLAYVHLLRDDALPALRAAQALLACSSLSPQQHFLGSCYAAEALCMLGRTAEAGEQLRSHLILYMDGSGAGSSGPASEAPAVGRAGPAAAAVAATAACASAARSVKSDDDGAGSRETYALGNAEALAALGGAPARATLLANLGSVAAQQGDLEECEEHARQALAADAECSAAQLLLVYARLVKGDSAGALGLLRGTGQPP